jgi:hypothetical protein
MVKRAFGDEAHAIDVLDHDSHALADEVEGDLSALTDPYERWCARLHDRFIERVG